MPTGTLPGGPTGYTNNDIRTLIQNEDKVFGVPDWVSLPLAGAESRWVPTAENQGHYGLYQISPTMFPGASGDTPQQLYDPKTNIDLALTQLHKAWIAQGSPGTPSQGAYENIISSSGWPWDQGWSGVSPADKANYDKAYQSYMSNPSQYIPDNGSGLGGVLGGIGNDLGQVGNGVGNVVAGAGSIKDNVTGFLSNPLGSIVGGFKGFGWQGVVIVAALVLFVGAGWHVFNESTGGAGTKAAKAAAVA